MSAIQSYRRLFSLTGMSYVVIAFLGRLPLAMSQMGVLMFVASRTGSFGAGGTCAGALAVANAIGAPAAGSLADRLGQRPVVLVQSLAGATGLGVIVLIVESGAGWGWAALAAAGAGLMLPQVGPLARVRWRPVIARHHAGQHLLDTAFSYEGSADEATFVLGPALVGILAAIVDPAVGLIGALVVLAVFGTLFALHPTARMAHPETTAATGTARLLTLGLFVLAGAQLIIGMVFGSVQTGATVIATDAGHAGIAGLLHATLGVGSVVAGLCMAALPASIGHLTRWRATAGGLLVLAVPLLVVHSIGTLVPVLLVLGLCVAPYMITTFTLGESITPVNRTGAAMTLLAAATGMGYAVGAAIAGRLADIGGETPAFAVTVVAGLLALTLSTFAGRALRPAEDPRPVPTPALGSRP
ncbi:MFS transporter [Leekyejoonella antrihumi]|uniref:MFS transporter n=1 Tax=Leekyejoonella antrihumi TaxID=1660198 RepID=A0A563E8V2_9MICO|nr:MFS transporter [Leekyejoonella antrihumi]TWP38946.1 MFS transporter [Leekyejoonella antrihumi]